MIKWGKRGEGGGGRVPLAIASPYEVADSTLFRFKGLGGVQKKYSGKERNR